MKQGPWVKWYWADWRSDPKLRMCSIAARGLWAEMLALMQEAAPYGHLLISGRAPTDAQLAVLAGMPADELPPLLGELEAAGVFSRTRTSTIYSRRMVRDEKKAKVSQKNGKYGGNPKLCNQMDFPPSDNPQLILVDKPQKLEAKKPEKEKETPNGVSKNPAAGTRLPTDWNPSNQDFDFAASTGMGHDAIFREADRFRDYWIGQAGAKGRKADWPATWRNWVRRACEDGQPNTAKPNKLRTRLDAIAASAGISGNG